jgi:hypothetical protein
VRRTRDSLGVLKLREAAVAWREVDGEAMLLDLRSSTYLATNPSGTLLWRRLAEGTTRDALVDALVETFGIPTAHAAADVDAFLEDCRARELVDEVEEDA